MTSYYKFLNEDGSTLHGGSGTWHLPADGKPGKWMPKLEEGKLELCRYGYHLMRREDVIHWAAPALFVADYTGKKIDGDDKVVVARARLNHRIEEWNERTARLFAADCAERAISAIPETSRQIFADTIQTVRLFANGDCSKQDLSAARSAAENAAWSAAENAARSAAWSAAENAARSAAWSAAWSWQIERLFYYLEGERTPA